MDQVGCPGARCVRCIACGCSAALEALSLSLSFRLWGGGHFLSDTVRSSRRPFILFAFAGIAHPPSAAYMSVPVRRGFPPPSGAGIAAAGAPVVAVGCATGLGRQAASWQVWTTMVV